jgi:dihydrofolate reductase
MRKVTLQMYLTLDGFAEFPEYPGSGDTPPGEEDPSAEMWVKNWPSTDTLLFGRTTYEQWADFWPASKRAAEETPFYHEMSRFVDSAQKVVFSNTIRETTWPNSRIMRGDVAAAVAQLRKEPGKNMAVVGGTCFAHQLMRENLIDEYFLTVFPVILGRGPQLYGRLPAQQTLGLVSSKSYPHGELFLHYRVLRPG